MLRICACCCDQTQALQVAHGAAHLYYNTGTNDLRETLTAQPNVCVLRQSAHCPQHVSIAALSPQGNITNLLLQQQPALLSRVTGS